MRVAHQNFRSVLFPAAIAIVFVPLSRALAVYPSCLFFSRSVLKIKLKHQHILFWGGLRGALALALALGLPIGMPRRDEIITVAFAVVGFSILTQGLTIKPFMRTLGELPADK